MKRKLFLMAIAAVSVLVMMSCGSKAADNGNDNDVISVDQGDPEEEIDEDEAPAPKTEEAVLDMLREAYADANLVSHPVDEMEPNLDLYGMYCSKAFNKKLEQIRAIDAGKPVGARCEMFDNELSNWIYWEGATVTITNASADVDGDTADATYFLTNGDDTMLTNVLLIYENGQWRIDNWVQIGEFEFDLRVAMDEYIEENR